MRLETKLERPVPKRFNFTWAIPGGAWIEDTQKQINWYSFTTLHEWYGKDWVDRQIQRQGWMTGCWIDCQTESVGVQ